MNWIKKNKILAIVALVIIVFGGVGGFILISGKTKSANLPVQTEEKPIKQVGAEEIGLSLEARADGKAIIMKIKNLTGISSLEYEVSYDAQVIEEGEQMNIPRGAVGSPIEIKPTDTSITREILLGTCSANTCKYDNVTSGIKFLIKINYRDGQVGSVQQSISL